MKYIVLILVMSFCSSCITPETKTNKPLTDDVQGFGNNRLVFKFNKFEFLALKDNQIDRQKTYDMSGTITFTAKKIVMTNDDGLEEFTIIRKIKHEDGYELRTRNNKDENFIFAIMVVKGINTVSMHFVELETISMFYITEGFTLNIPIYNE